MKQIQYQYDPEHFRHSDPNKYNSSKLKSEEMILSLGPQHPSTHGVLRLEVISDGELIVDVVPHLGYLHRCFEKHAESLAFGQTIPYIDRLDYLAAMNSEHAYVMGVEKMLDLEGKLPKRIEYIRVLVAELNRLASHFVAIGTYGLDIGAYTSFLWLMRDREHIQRLLEWLCGARMLYNYIWIGGLFYDLPVGFEERCLEFINYLKPKMVEIRELIIENKIFVQRTANIGVLPLDLAINYGCTGPVLRGSGLKFDLRRVDGYSVYPELDFEIPVGKGEMGTVGDCWDRNFVRVLECDESIKIIEQCLVQLMGDHKRTRDFNPQAMLPKKVRPQAMDLYFRAENPKGELGFFFRTDGRSDVPLRVKARACSFHNLSVVPEISRGAMLADLVAIVGSVDLVMGEVDR
ncbi:NADH-quinone oxidoreductase subunit D [Flectobacillus longus]|jgi:NADH-quinone oxidoreductase subunit D|uniref:NADH-quinone oxidoreductase subunit D n=1 Tax=Flectobacillus longus TaxID=2984207 RepID=A0ABT6YM35_9BACT|nr:NADH-quinone oxidoreductase subunit D [Flectobacillus longus]MDI9864629.1 NADH-quinone oxidoreductase subunit D [Flectobacillus longus]MDI9880482.1 NADH-quinone oxidoreductase subunit D [Flectobacillus longus]